MPDAFFRSGQRKRKRVVPKTNGRAKKSKRDEELSDDSDSEVELRADEVDGGESGSDDAGETPAEKRLRLARILLEERRAELAGEEADAAEIDREILASRLREDTLKHSGKISLFLADKLDTSSPPTRSTRRQRLPVTAAVASDDATLLFTASKDGSIAKWSLQTITHLKTYSKILIPASERKGKGKIGADIEGHVDEILALALSFDGKYLVSGGRDRRIVVWDISQDRVINVFTGHKDAITALAFRKNTLQLYSASLDRTIKLHDLGVMGYVETLFGHQDGASSLDALLGETALSAGMRDRTVRYWKIADETQLVFRGGGRSKLREVLEGGMEEASGGEEDGDVGKKGKAKATKSFVEGSVDCVAMLDESTFVSGGDSGSICLWSVTKKKPVFTHPLAHGMHECVSESEGVLATPRWITALGALRHGDTFASGSYDSSIRVWRLDEKARSFSAITSVTAPGFVNSLQMVVLRRESLSSVWAVQSPVDGNGATNGKSHGGEVVLVAGLGQEPRMGRWMRMHGQGEKNTALVVVFRYN